MIIIGLTGSIGMGKTETSKLFAAEGIPVFDSDAAVHSLLEAGGGGVNAVGREFPVALVGNKIDRKKLGQVVFGNDVALQKLENILHPMVTTLRNKFLDNASTDIVLFDIPLLFEKSYEADCDFVVVVSAPFEVQKERVLRRSGMTEDRFMSILSKQMPDEEKRRRADFVVDTDKGLVIARIRVKEIIKNIKEG